MHLRAAPLFLVTALAAAACTTSSSAPAPTKATSSGATGSGGTTSGGTTSGGTSSGGASSGGATSGGTTSGTSGGAAGCSPAPQAGELYALTANDLAGDPVPLCQFRGKVLLVFNGASQCGYTPQYKPLQDLYDTYKARGFEALGFPCNQFGGQEPGSSAEISEFCTTQYHITFPMFEKIDVNGPTTHPIFQWLKSQPGGAGDITWNFEKFVIGRDGKLIKRFPPATPPDDPEVLKTLEEALGK